MHDSFFDNLVSCTPTSSRTCRGKQPAFRVVSLTSCTRLHVVQIRVVELMDHVLSTYDRAIGVYTAEQFKRAGITLVLNSRVAKVEDGVVQVGRNNSQELSGNRGRAKGDRVVARQGIELMLNSRVPGGQGGRQRGAGEPH